MEADSAVSSVRIAGGYRFGIVYGRETTVANDPVANDYRAGSLAHLRTLIKVAGAVLKPGDRVLDLGAHLGGFALTAAAMGCEVLAVEASPRNTELLRQSAEHNRFEKLRIVQAAVGDEQGSVEFSCHGPWGHLATPATGMPTVSVAAVRVDDLLEQHGWENVRFIKLDVEGSEIRAIRGMAKLLSRRDAPIIYFESNKHTLNFYQQTEGELKAELRRLGYVLYDVQLGKLVRVQDGDEQEEVCQDYLAAKELPEGLAKWEGSWLMRVGRWVGVR